MLTSSARIQQAATSPARSPISASLDAFEQKTLKSGPSLSGTALNAVTPPQLETPAAVASGAPALTAARLGSLTGKDLLANSAIIGSGLGALGAEARGIRGDDAEAASELLEEQFLEAQGNEYLAKVAEYENIHTESEAVNSVQNGREL